MDAPGQKQCPQEHRVVWIMISHRGTNVCQESMSLTYITLTSAVKQGLYKYDGICKMHF